MRIVAGLGDASSSIARKLLDTLRWPEGTSVHVVGTGRPSVAALLEAAHRADADLILLGGQDEDEGSPGLVPVEIDLIGLAPCPVLVARAPRVTRILLALRGPSGLDALLEALARWDALRDVPIDALSVVPPAWSVTDFITPWAPTPASRAREERALELERHRSAACDAARELSALGMKATPRVRFGRPGLEHVAAAEEFGSDLIAVTAQGRRDPDRPRLDSLARDVLQGAKGSVLVVREPSVGLGLAPDDAVDSAAGPLVRV